MFIDEVTVTLKSGDGGDGCVSFRRERFRPKGGPDGGNGGKGGSVILVCDENVADLTDYKFAPKARAENGEAGKGNSRFGKNGRNKELPVPPGLVVSDAETGEVWAELLTHGEEILLLKGGLGGVGNESFKSPEDQAPRRYTPGEPGEERSFKFVLKTIADAGMVGLPNAGKSSLMGKLTRNQPKTGAYPFTTLHPSVGIIHFDEKYARASLADIPGLVEGAHENRGLGHRFLRHIERCRSLLLIIDFAGVDGRSPLEDYATLLDELRRYDPAMLEKPISVVANKIDLPASAAFLTAFRQAYPEVPLLPISVETGEGLDALKAHLATLAPAKPSA